MVKLLFDFVQLLYAALPLLTCVAALALLGILCSGSIKRHAVIWYTVLGLPFALVALPFIGRMFGVEIFSFSRIPFLGGILRDYIHAGTFGFPLLIIIMYMGALDVRLKWVKKLMSIRKELSIISGFPIFTHSLIRVSSSFPGALRYFTRHGEAMETARVVNETGLWFSNFSFVLGIVLLVVFIPLWVTSFDSIHKRMGGVRWKKLQRWSYVLYALLFIHALFIQVGGLLNPRGGGRGNAPIETARAASAAPGPATPETVRAQSPAPQSPTAGEAPQANPERRGRDGREGRSGETPRSGESPRSGETPRNGQPNVQPEGGRSNPETAPATASPARGGHVPGIGLADVKVAPLHRQYLHILSLLLIFGSYLYLRLRKAKASRAGKASRPG